ncbi:hypothetical protein WN943_029573 [Citrus x changshan-huyou]
MDEEQDRDEHKRIDSSSDAPVMIEAKRDIVDVRVAQLASIRENRRKPSLLSYLELRELSKIELVEENKTSANKKSREVEARGAVCTRVGARSFRGMKKKKDIAREMRRLAMDLGVSMDQIQYCKGILTLRGGAESRDFIVLVIKLFQKPGPGPGPVVRRLGF